MGIDGEILMSLKPLMMMRKKGLLGPKFGQHATSTCVLSKSVGNFIESQSRPLLAPSFTGTLALPDGVIGDSYSYNVSALNAGGVIATYALVSPLPTGLVMDTTSGNITGVVTTAGTFTPSITGTNATGSDTTNIDSVTISA